jgi:RimJ/RimL family protein N-acetyltransferase
MLTSNARNSGRAPHAVTRPWVMVDHVHWPFFSLEIRTPRLELRYPSDDDLLALAGILSDGIHDLSTMPFSEPWTRASSPELERNALQFWWSRRASLAPDNWTLPFAVFEDGVPLGVQDVGAKHFATARTVTTGSWLVQHAQGRGVGKEMRASVLHFAFAGLGAVEAYTSAFEDNPASLGVTRALGYQPNGERIDAREGKAVRHLEFALRREDWERTRRGDITISALEPCLPLLGAV